MNQPVNYSRRQILSSVGGPALLVPMCYPLLGTSAALAQSPDTPNSETRHGNDSRFLVRDFISPRLELVRLLKEITEVEHSLMLQYLYAGFSIKPEFASLAGDGRPDSNSFIGVAVQEMQHLGSINKLLVALGASPFLDIQDLPFEVDIYPFPLQLESLSRRSVAKYAYCEASADAVAGLKNDDSRFVAELTQNLQSEGKINHVGSVYGILIGLLEELRKSDKKLKLDFDYWLSELKHIMDEGEVDHFTFFKSVFMGTHPAFVASPHWWQHAVDSKHYPAYQLVENPSAYFGHAQQIEDEVALKMAWLSNLHYWSILVLLDLYYRTNDTSLKFLSISYMLSPLKSIGSALAKRGYGLPFDRLSLGYSPSRNPADNLGFAIQLQTEANKIRMTLEGHLPPDYPDSLELVCIRQLHTIADNWSQKGNNLDYGASVFNG